MRETRAAPVSCNSVVVLDAGIVTGASYPTRSIPARGSGLCRWLRGRRMRSSRRTRAFRSSIDIWSSPDSTMRVLRPTSLTRAIAKRCVAGLLAAAKRNLLVCCDRSEFRRSEIRALVGTIAERLEAPIGRSYTRNKCGRLVRLLSMGSAAKRRCRSCPRTIPQGRSPVQIYFRPRDLIRRAMRAGSR
jgi:hypothetical protein